MEGRLALQEDAEAIAKIETEEGVALNKFQCDFGVMWRGLVRKHLKEHTYLELWELADKIMGRVSPQFPTKAEKKIMGKAK